MIHSYINEKDDNRLEKNIRRISIKYLVICILKLAIMIPTVLLLTLLDYDIDYTMIFVGMCFALLILVIAMIYTSIALVTQFYSNYELANRILGHKSATLTSIVSIMDILTSLLIGVYGFYYWLFGLIYAVILIIEFILIIISILSRENSHE